ncbi:UNVERIFIED_CONTAM: hypothetical protein K2H54_001870 [Gekko kuhli]
MVTSAVESRGCDSGSEARFEPRTLAEVQRSYPLDPIILKYSSRVKLDPHLRKGRTGPNPRSPLPLFFARELARRLIVFEFKVERKYFKAGFVLLVYGQPV